MRHAINRRFARRRAEACVRVDRPVHAGVRPVDGGVAAAVRFWLFARSFRHSRIFQLHREVGVWLKARRVRKELGEVSADHDAREVLKWRP